MEHEQCAGKHFGEVVDNDYCTDDVKIILHVLIL